MTLSLSKTNTDQVTAAAIAAGLHGQGRADFLTAVETQLAEFNDPLQRGKAGFTDHSSGHVASAISMVLGRSK
jgi:hypothetical protein